MSRDSQSTPVSYLLYSLVPILAEYSMESSGPVTGAWTLNPLEKIVSVTEVLISAAFGRKSS